MNIGEATNELFESLKSIYTESEASQITDLVIEHITGLTKSERIQHKQSELNNIQDSTFKIQLKELLNHKPVQYVLQEAWFYGIKFYVDENVLIPRPETEELVDWVVKNALTITDRELSILDIGTGSGCIPITLKKKIPAAKITAIDVCSEALYVAINNAATYNAEIDFRLLDFLDLSKWNELPQFDIIISNPPYITSSEKEAMNKNVLEYEPHKALFINDDALLFYRNIADFGKTHLTNSGNIYVEINETYGNESKNVFANENYSKIELKKDMQGKDRMIKASY
ncbi:MAG: peptide chain release factor N(5)-glutamine methyltransferase [Bacteroidota bacterium]